ncbi:TonB-dependent receptor [Nitrospirillum sp. BR 11164]|uniref:TonB-dependent receptor n=1 Tax=Nitrospirillum sp. BR 11164 TaxID=3104324 RepID=UPI002AFDDA58|nr:TonB-dependent receptor [Nitrospirillum sp. BR 11164]MEA1648640.1 TonB-dependent receptor [Nitrospirillum sp. BR 11164]
MGLGKFRAGLLAGSTVMAFSLPAMAGSITGTIVDPGTGKPLAGTAITIPGTGYSTASGEDGTFTLANVPEGSYTVTASRSGLHTSSTRVTVPRDGAVTVSFEAYTAALQEIIVAANRYQASSLQMNASNTVDVMSAADLEHTAVHNVAEALGLLPGVNVMSQGQSFVGGIGAASRGEGMFTSIRGLNGEYNVNLINGANVAQGMPYSREVQLSLLPPSGLNTIVVNKTSKADMDGDAIGGTVDFRTPTAFDYSEPLMFSFTASGRLETRAQDYKKDSLGYGLAGEGAGKFGRDNQFGVYVSAYYDIRHYANSEMGAVAETTCCDNAWAFAVANADGTNPSNLNPAKNLETTGFNVGVSTGFTKRYGGNVSLDWQPDETASAYFRLSYAVAETQQNSNLSQLIGMNVTYDQIGSTPLYHPNIQYLSTRFWYETNPEYSDLATAQFGGEKKWGNWTFSPNVFMSWGDNDRPDHIEISTRSVQNDGNGFAYGNNTLATYVNDFPYPLVGSDVIAQLGNVASLPARDRGEITAQLSGQVKGGGKFDTRYDVNAGPLEFIKFGAKYQVSERQVTNRDWYNGNFDDGRTFGSLGIISGNYSSVYPGIYNWSVPIIDQAALFRLYNTYAYPGNLDSCSSLYINNWNCNTQKGTEAVSAAYVMANLKFDDLEIVPGFRFEHTSIHNTFWVTPHDADGNELAGHWGYNSTHYNEPLPSIFANYRPDENSVYRAAIWTSYTRPPFVQLGGGSQTSISNGVTTITEGNPNLKAITAVNYDLSGQWDSGHGGTLVVAGYAKQLSNYIYDNGSTYSNPAVANSGSVIFHHPTNGGDGQVYGIELSARQKFQDMPAPFDGFGIGANLTRQWTSVDTKAPGLDPNERIQNAPEWMANIEAFYEKDGFTLDLIYHYTGAYVTQYDYLGLGGSWDDLWIRPVQRVDLHAGYDFGYGVRADVSVSNLFDDISYWSHIGKESLAISDIVDTGRTILVSMKYSY